MRIRNHCNILVAIDVLLVGVIVGVIGKVDDRNRQLD
jgi:hypothetical protein